MVAARELLQTGAHRLALCPAAQHVLHQLLDLRLGKGHEARGAMGSVLAKACLGIVVIADAVGTAAGLPGDLLEDLLERQALLLGLVGGLPQQLGFGLAPARVTTLLGKRRLFHDDIPPNLLTAKNYVRECG